jgi:hypothetical protein
VGKEDLEARASTAVQEDAGGRARLHRGIAAQRTGVPEVLPAGGPTQYSRSATREVTVRAGNITRLHRNAIDPITTVLRSNSF